MPKDAQYARDYIAELRQGNPNKKARIRMAELAIQIGNYTEEAKDVWRQYLETELATRN